MRSFLPIRIVAVAATLSPLAARAQSGAPQQVRLNDAVPAGVRTTQLVVSSDARHVYYGDSTRAIWFYDRTDRRNIRLTNSGASDLTISPAGDAIAYVKTEPGSSEQHVWVLPLDARSGLARGAERRVSAMQGDTPAISSDGKWIAFAADDSAGVGQGVAVAATAGGRERLVVPFLHAGIGSVRWSADAQTLYFAVNPPVSCNPDWSCLPLKDEFSQRLGSVHRVAVSGGTPTVVAPRAGAGWPGLSTDGSMLVYRDTGSDARVIVSDTAGRQLNAFAMPGRETVEGWMNGSTLLLSDRGSVRRVRILSIADGSVRVISDTLDQLVDGVFSPDGRTVSVARCADRCELRLIGLDATTRSVIPLPDRYAGGGAWSPDGKWIAYFASATPSNRKAEIVDVATGRVVPLAAVGSSVGTLLWQSDSRALIISTNSGSGAQHRVSFERVDLEGHVQPLRQFVVGPTPSGGGTFDDHSGTLNTNGEVRRVTLDGDSTNTLLVSLHGQRLAGVPAAAAGAQRLAIRRTRDAEGGYNFVDVMNLDGTDRVTIELPFEYFPGPNGLRMLPGGKQFVVYGGPWTGEAQVGIYLVDVATRSWKKIGSLPPSAFAGELALSPDGKSVLYMTSDISSPRVFTMDLSSFKR